MENVLLTREQHDQLAGCRWRSDKILQILFMNYNRKWTLAGVTFSNVKPEHIAELRERLGDFNEEIK
jgi:hypothetical protein